MILRIEDVVAQVGLSRATIYRKMAEGKFPKPVRLSQRAIGWRETDITTWVNALTYTPQETRASASLSR